MLMQVGWNFRKGQEESLAAAIASQAIEAQPAFGQIEPSEAAWFAWVRQLLKENSWRISSDPRKRPCSWGEEKETLA